MSEIINSTIRDIGFFKALLTEIKLSFKGSELQNEIIFLSKVLSVGIYLDKKITTLELDKAKDIVRDEMGEEWENYYRGNPYRLTCVYGGPATGR